MRKLVPCSILQNEADPLKLREIIRQNIPKLENALTGNLHWYSQNALLVPHSLKIITIESIEAERYKMLYSFEWNVFNACLDINATETAQETVEFKIIPGALVFELINDERPSTADEL
ncbi:hypothetical protein PMPD1_1238 [Paramixta manurensis]|uniref:Uncharacterized protein n=1 Tax=Paramixta manurensis TaxID=2740817 RepID=A0A6M8ULA3_9GAMM|nr:hypothetical protein PMPD1_1238 [Erwiniaceae bacterium PD-1]